MTTHHQERDRTVKEVMRKHSGSASGLPMSEDQLQKAIFDHIRSRGVPGLIAFHPRNSGRDQRDPKARAINAARGVLTGASDVILFHDGEFYALELKVGVNKPTDEQLAFLAAVEAQGGYAAWHRGLRAAVHQLERWGLVRGKMA